GERAERELRAALAAVEVGGGPRLVATRAVAGNRLADHLLRHGLLDDAEPLFAAALAELTPADDPALGRPEELQVRGYSTWGLGRVAFLRERYVESVPLLQQAAELYEAAVSAYPSDPSLQVSLASVLTEFAQVRRQLGAPSAELDAMLSRARSLFKRVAGGPAVDSRGRESRRVCLDVLCGLRAGEDDGARLADAARELAEIAGEDARRSAMAAWHLLHAAAMLDGEGDAAAARSCDDSALAALEACDTAGWFPPVNLDDPPCRRLDGRAAFESLRQRHPPSQAAKPGRR
ncbi:MAG: hypothetical protein KDC98_15815, partial [Planctomycetes bacterium]|nr:hypothetical protein [Planctomycetota bacterium]